MRIAIFGIWLGCAVPAWGDQVTAIYAGGNANDNRNCAFFQTKANGAAWFAVPYSDAGYRTEWNIIQEAHTTQTNNFTFYTAGAACGFSGATGISIQGP